MDDYVSKISSQDDLSTRNAPIFNKNLENSWKSEQCKTWKCIEGIKVWEIAISQVDRNSSVDVARETMKNGVEADRRYRNQKKPPTTTRPHTPNEHEHD